MLNSLPHHADNIEFSLGFTGYNSDRIKSNKGRLTSYCSHWPSLLFLNSRRKSIVSICFCNGLLYYFSCATAIGTEKNSPDKTRVKALKIICGKPDENLQPPQAGHTDLHVYTAEKVYWAQTSTFISPWYAPRNKKNKFYICCAGRQTKVCMPMSKENSYDISHTSSSQHFSSKRLYFILEIY